MIADLGFFCVCYDEDGRIIENVKNYGEAVDPAFNNNRAEQDKVPFEMFVEPVETLNVVDTYQFDDYSKYTSSMFDSEAKQKHREEQFPNECRQAYELGKKLAGSLS